MDLPTWGPWASCLIWIVTAIAGPHVPGLKKMFGRKWNWFENLCLMFAVASLNGTQTLAALHSAAIALPGAVWVVLNTIWDAAVAVWNYMQAQW